MGQDIACERCKKRGNVALGFRCPPGWLFMEATDSDNDDNIIVFACSLECAHALWRPCSELRSFMYPPVP
jgi:hypothetical protein